MILPVAPFWEGAGPLGWRYTRIVADIEDPGTWRDMNGHSPFAPGSANLVAETPALNVLTTMRNAVGHGNIIYLNDSGLEVPGEELRIIALFERARKVDGGGHWMVAMPEPEMLRLSRSGHDGSKASTDKLTAGFCNDALVTIPWFHVQ